MYINVCLCVCVCVCMCVCVCAHVCKCMVQVGQKRVQFPGSWKYRPDMDVGNLWKTSLYLNY